MFSAGSPRGSRCAVVVGESLAGGVRSPISASVSRVTGAGLCCTNARQLSSVVTTLDVKLADVTAATALRPDRTLRTRWDPRLSRVPAAPSPRPGSSSGTGSSDAPGFGCAGRLASTATTLASSADRFWPEARLSRSATFLATSASAGRGPDRSVVDAAGVLPQGEAERLPGQGSVDPRHRDPLVRPVVAQPDHRDVVGVVVDLPLLVRRRAAPSPAAGTG